MSTKPYNFDNFWADYGSGVMAAYPAHEAQNIRELCRLSWITCIAMAPELPEPAPTTAAQGGRKVDPEVCTHENVTMVCLDCQPAAQGGETREKLARHLQQQYDAEYGRSNIEEFYGEADKILSLIHPQPGREQAK